MSKRLIPGETLPIKATPVDDDAVLGFDSESGHELIGIKKSELGGVYPVVVKAASFIAEWKAIYLIDTAGELTITLPPMDTYAGVPFEVWNEGGATLTLQCVGDDMLKGLPSLELPPEVWSFTIKSSGLGKGMIF